MLTGTKTGTAGALCRLWDRGELDRVRSADGAQKLHGRRFALHLLAQPVIAERALSDDVLAGQGFLARCLLAWPTGTAGNRSYRAESLRADPAMLELQETLRLLHRRALPLADGERQALEPRQLTLTPGAFEEWRGIHDAIERGMGIGGPFAQVKAWASKAPEQVARIAGVLTLVEDAEAPHVEADAIQRAAELALWHLGEAVRLTGTAALSPEVLDAEALLAWCHETGRQYLHSADALRLGPARIRERPRFAEAVRALESAGWAQSIAGGMVLGGKYLANGWDPVLAYRAVARLHGSRARYDRRGASKLKPANRMVRRWLQHAIPYIRQMLAEERTRSAHVIQSAYSYLALVMSTSPATFLKHEDDGRVEFDLGQAHITPAQRAMIVSLTVDPETQRIRQIRTPDPTKAVDQVIRLMELERTAGNKGDGDSTAGMIRARFEKARLHPGAGGPPSGRQTGAAT